MSTQLVKAGQTDIVREGAFDLTPHSLSEAIQLAELMAKSDLVPTQFRNKPGDVLVACQYGAEVGLKPLQAMQGIAVINGRPTLWGDAALGVVQASGLMENYKEMTLDEIEAAGKAVFWAKRKGQAEPIVREFSIENAKKARLWSKPGPWQDYPWRMLQMRARSWGLRDGFSDVLKGLAIREEIEDIETTEEAPKVLAMPRRMSERQTESQKDETAAAPGGPVQNNAAAVTGDQGQSEPTPGSKIITEAQRKRMYALARGSGMNDAQFKGELERMGYKSSKDVLVKDYQDICQFFENWKP